jgi:hypothetical protein
MHFDANNKEDECAGDEDGFAIVDVADMMESPGKNLVPIDDGSVGDAVLTETVGLVDDLVAHELPTDSPAYSGGGTLNWLDKNKKRDGSFNLSFSNDDSECDSDFITLPPGVFPLVGVSQNWTAAIPHTSGQKSLKRNNYLVIGSFLNISRSDSEAGYLPPSFPARSWWLHKVKHKQHFCWNARKLISGMFPALPFVISNYQPWAKKRDSYVVIEEDSELALNLMILPPTMPGLTVLPSHSFPIFRTKANALFYGRLTILLTVLHSSFFSTVFRES